MEEDPASYDLSTDIERNVTHEEKSYKKNHNQIIGSQYSNQLNIINQDYAYINLWHPNIIWIGSNCLKNIRLEPTGGFYPLLNIEKKHGEDCGK